LLSFLARIFSQSQHLDAVAAQGLDVGWTNETSPCYANADGLLGKLFCHEFSMADPKGF
jgi:hypothetical protein